MWIAFENYNYLGQHVSIVLGLANFFCRENI
jgi:hypothetical protein